MLVITSRHNQHSYPDDISYQAVAIKQSDSIYTKITRFGLALEEYMQTNQESQAAFVWAPNYQIDPLIFSNLPIFGTDEILFSSLDMELPVGWAAGHVYAMIKWAATCRDTETIDFVPWPQIKGTPSSTANIVWWAQRINLRVYGHS
jgi:hypothetical protein